MSHMNPWQLDRFDDGVFETMTREEYHRFRSAARRMVTPGLEGLAQFVVREYPRDYGSAVPAKGPQAKPARGRRDTPAPAQNRRGRRS